MYKKIIAPCILTVIVLLIYSQVFYSPFVLDDTDNIVDNLRIKDLSNLLDFSGSRYVSYLSFALNYYMGGLNTFGYHVTNIVIHIINGILVYALVCLTFRTPALGDNLSAGKPRFFSSHVVAFISAVIFISHPIQTQAITYITQRFASLATLFYLLALVLYIKARLLQVEREGKKEFAFSTLPMTFYVFSLISTILAMKTKEISFTLPFVLMLYEFAFFTTTSRNRPLGERINRKKIYPLLPFLLSLLIIPLSRIDAGVSIGDVSESVGRVSYLLTQFRVIVTYLRLLVLPVNQNLDYDYPVYDSFFDYPVLLSFLFLLSVFVLVLYLFFQSRKKGSRYGLLISFGFLWFFITLSIESSIVPLLNLIFEHRLYLPSVGFFIASTTALCGGFQWVGERWLVAGGGETQKGVNGVLLSFFLCAIVVTSSLSVATYRRNLVWKDDFTLWSDAVAKSPNNARPHVNLGVAYYNRGSKDNAIAEYLKALELKPDAAMAHLGLGRVYADKGRLHEARKEYKIALELEPDFVQAYNNLGNIYLIQREFSLAVQQYEEALRLNPDNIEVYYNLALAYEEIGSTEAAMKHYRAFIKMAPLEEYRISIERAKRRLQTLSF